MSQNEKSGIEKAAVSMNPAQEFEQQTERFLQLEAARAALETIADTHLEHFDEATACLLFGEVSMKQRRVKQRIDALSAQMKMEAEL